MKIVCDTNVIISALIFPGGTPDKIMRGVLSGNFQNYTSPDLLTELRRILIKKFSLSKSETEDALQPLISCSKLVYPTERINIITRDEADNRVLECSAAASADYLITGDKKHLLPLKKFEGTKILSPKEFGLVAGIL